MSIQIEAMSQQVARYQSGEAVSRDTESKSQQVKAMTKQMVHYSTIALIFFSIAWFCLTVGVFTVNPVGPTGIFFLCVGLPCVAISIFYFVRYALISGKIKKTSQSETGSGR